MWVGRCWQAEAARYVRGIRLHHRQVGTSLVDIKDRHISRWEEIDIDDHKFITERLLDVAIPEDAPKDVVKLEQCLEEYFNNKVEVRRKLIRRNTLQSVHSSQSPVEKANAVHVENAEVDSTCSTPIATEFPKSQPLRPAQAQRHASIFSERKVEIQESARLRRSSSCREDEAGPPGRRRKGSMRREVSIPAWQFLNLIRQSATIYIVPVS